MGWEHSQCSGNATTKGSFKDVIDALDGPAGAEYARRWPELVKIREGDHLCVPVRNSIVGNVYSSVGRFMDAAEKDVTSWLSDVSGNVNQTHGK